MAVRVTAYDGAAAAAVLKMLGGGVRASQRSRVIAWASRRSLSALSSSPSGSVTGLGVLTASFSPCFGATPSVSSSHTSPKVPEASALRIEESRSTARNTRHCAPSAGGKQDASRSTAVLFQSIPFGFSRGNVRGLSSPVGRVSDPEPASSFASAPPLATDASELAASAAGELAAGADEWSRLRRQARISRSLELQNGKPNSACEGACQGS